MDNTSSGHCEAPICGIRLCTYTLVNNPQIYSISIDGTTMKIMKAYVKLYHFLMIFQMPPMISFYNKKRWVELVHVALPHTGLGHFVGWKFSYHFGLTCCFYPQCL